MKAQTTVFVFVKPNSQLQLFTPQHPALAAGRGEGGEEGGAPAEPSVR